MGHPSPALRAHVRARAEDRPGVYRMYQGDQLLYVGKSVRVRSRVLSYFSALPGEKPGKLIRRATRIAWDYHPNEFEALVREMRLIQRHRPPFNVQHKRRRRHAFVKVTREVAPRLLPVTRVADDDALYFGPFPRVRRVADTVRELAHVLQLRDCSSTTPVFFDDQLEIFGEGGRAPRCLRGDLGTCLAPCAGRPSAADYAARVALAVRFMEGRGEGVLRLLDGRIRAAAAAWEFEHAATLRDRAERLRRFRTDLTGWKGEVEGLTFVYRVPGFRGADRLYLLRRGRIAGVVEHPKGREARARVAERVREVYRPGNVRALGLDADAAAEIVLVAAWFRRKPRELRRTLAPEAWLERKGRRDRSRI